MMVKSAQPGEGAGARHSPFTLSTITSKVVLYSLGKNADHKLRSVKRPKFDILFGENIF
jgi:hypothetical protein